MTKVIEEYYIKNHDKMVKEMAARCGNFHDAEDIVQQAFLNALEYYDEKRVEVFDGWIIGILNNAYLKHINDTRHYGMGMEIPEDSYVDFDECDGVVKDLILKEIGSKRQPTRSVLFMHFVQEMPQREICDFTGLNREAVHKALSRFRSQFKQKYGGDLVT